MSEGRSGVSTSAPTVLRMILGQRLQELRQGAGVSLEDAAKALQREAADHPQAGEGGGRAQAPLRGEAAARPTGPTQQEVDEFVALAERANEPGWWHAYRDVVPDWFSAYVSLETGAKTLRTYEPHYVTGLLQTHDYARAVLRGGLPERAATRTWRGGSICGCAGRACWREPTRPRCGS